MKNIINRIFKFSLQKIRINIREILIQSIKELEKKNSTTDNIKEETNKDINNSILYLCCKYLINKTNHFSNNLDVVFKKFNLFIIISMSLWFSIKDEITKIIFTFINNDYISKSKIINTPFFILIIMLLLCIAYFYPKYKREYVYSKKTIIIYTCIIIIYSYYRFISKEFIFYKPFFNYESIKDLLSIFVFLVLIFIITWKNKLSIIPIIITSGYYLITATIFKNTWSAAYLDIIFIIYLSIITIVLKKLYTFIKTYDDYKDEPSLLLGEAVEQEEEDILDYNDIAKQLANQICKLNNKKSFAVGITKHWGNGKSTFLNFLKKHIESNKRPSIIIDFSPWYCKSEIDIINLFFNTLAKNLRPHHRSLNNEISKYVKQILALKKNALTEYLTRGFSFLSDSTDIKDIYDRINKNICSLNKKVYIIIDDIDRLQAKEILECLKIIRNTANFQNIVFIVAYDPIYVDRAIKEGLNNNTKGYMDKIIQLPFQLPEIEEYKLHNYMSIEITKHLREYYPSKNHINNEELEKIVFTIMNPSYKERPSIGMTIEDTKDINYYRQNVSLHITNYVNNIRDCNKILNQLFTYHYLLKEEVELDDLLLVCIFKTIYPIEAKIIYNKLGEYISKDPKTPYFKEENKKEYKISAISDNIFIHDIIDAIFCKKSSSVKRAAINKYYKIYYNGIISKMVMKPSKFIIVIEDINDITYFINKMRNNKSKEGIGEYNDFALKLSKHYPKSKEEAIKIIYGLLYLKEKIKGYSFSSTIDIILKNHKNDAIYILKEIIESNTNISLLLISRLIRGIKESIIYGNNPKIPGVELNDIQPLSIKILELKINENIFDHELFNIYWDCLTRVENNMIIIPTNANNLMKSFAEKNPLRYIKSLEVPYNPSSDENIKSFEPSIAQTFSGKVDDFEPFETFLFKITKENNTDQEVQDIKEFWLEFKNNNHKYYKNISSNKKINFKEFNEIIKTPKMLIEKIEVYKKENNSKFENLIYKLEKSKPQTKKSASIIALGLLYYATLNKNKYNLQCFDWFNSTSNSRLTTNFFYDIEEEITNELDSFILFEQIKYKEALVNDKNKEEIEEKLIRQQIKQNPKEFFNKEILYNFCTYTYSVEKLKKRNNLISTIQKYVNNFKLDTLKYLYSELLDSYNYEYDGFHLPSDEGIYEWSDSYYLFLYFDDIIKWNLKETIDDKYSSDLIQAINLDLFRRFSDEVKKM